MTQQNKPVRPGRPEKYSADTVLQTALNLYWTEGAAALSVNDLVRRMGMPKPSLYRHFRSEDALQASVLLAYEAGPLARLNAVISQPGPFSVQLAAYLDALIDGIASHPQGCLLFQMRESQARLGPRAASASEAVFARYIAAVEAWLARAAAKSEINLQADARIAAHLFVGVITLVRNGFRDGLGEADVRAMVTAHMRGIFTLSDGAAAA